MCWACDHPGDGHQAYLHHIQGLIERHGWAVQFVGGTRNRAPFAYTVGLTAVGLPELVVTGLPADRATRLLNEVARGLAATDPPAPGSLVLLADGSEVEVVRVPHPEAHLSVALDLYGSWVAAVQLVWADDRGRLPWHPVFRSNRRGGQPVLGPRSPAGQLSPN